MQLELPRRISFTSHQHERERCATRYKKMGASVLVPEVRLAVASSSTAGDARVTLGPRAVRELGVQLGDPVAVDVRWGKSAEGDEAGGGGGVAADDEWTWTFLVRCPP